MSPRRVSSPRAAKRGAASRTGDLAAALGLDMTADVLHLLRPALLVHPERLGATIEWHAVEPGLHERERRPASGVLESELDERHRLLRVVDVGLGGIRVPAIREQHL